MIKFKRIAAALATAAMLSAITAASVSAYEAVGDWSVTYMKNAPSSVNKVVSVEIPTYGKGYKTYCSSINGANDRKVYVSAPGISKFEITSVGYSSKKSNPTGAGNTITFSFWAYCTSGGCSASGTVGYNK